LIAQSKPLVLIGHFGRAEKRGSIGKTSVSFQEARNGPEAGRKESVRETGFLP